MNNEAATKKPYKRADAAGLKARRAVILRGLKKGQTPKQITLDVEVSYGQVRAMIQNDPDLLALHKANRKSPVTLPPVGAVVPTIRQQSEGFQDWLVRSVPEGTTLADFMVSVVLDSYMDETEETDQSTESETT